MALDDKGDTDQAKVPELRWLRVLVTTLAGAMVLGVVAIAAILWLRLSEQPLPVLPANLQMPSGASAEAVTFARDWTVVVTQAGEILLFARDGTLRQRVTPD